MAKYVPKTKVEPIGVDAFTDAIENPQRQSEALILLEGTSKNCSDPALAV